MPEMSLERTVGRYCAWHKLVLAWTLLQWLLFISLALSAAYILCDKFFYLGFSYSLLPPVIGSACLLIVLFFYIFSARKVSHTGYLIDKNAGLKNLVLSGISVAGLQDEVSTVIVARARRALEKQSPRRLIPLAQHWTGRFLWVPLLASLVALLVPHVDLLGRQKKKEQAAAERLEVQKGALKLAAKLTFVEKRSETIESIESKKITGDFGKLADSLMGVAKKDALLKLGEFENKYRDDFSSQRDFEQAVAALQPELDRSGLSPGSREELAKLAKNLNEGRFGDAGKAVRELAGQLQGKGLSSQQKRALARELAKIARKMQGYGMKDDLARLLNEIESSREDVGELLRQCEMAGLEMDKLAGFCDEAENLKAMRDGLAEAKREVLGELFKDFDAMEVEQYMKRQAELGLMCKNCSGIGCKMCDGTGICKGKGFGGTGGEGKGWGHLPPENMADSAFESRKSPSKINKGKILHQLFVSGVPEKGEALAEYTDVVQAAKQDAAGSLAREKIPREYEDMVKTYFDSLEVRESGEEADP